jgi:hypothetical protein
MRHEVKKIAKIVDELITFFFLRKTHVMGIEIKDIEDHYEITITNDCRNLDNDEIDSIKKLFSVQRQREMEEYYWQLTGEADTDTELTLVGIMIDKVDISVSDEKLVIKLTRYKE